MQAVSVVWNGWVVAVLFSPYVWPVRAETLNYAPVIMGIVTVFGVVSWWVVPAEKWLPSQRIREVLEADERSGEGEGERGGQVIGGVVGNRMEG